MEHWEVNHWAYFGKKGRKLSHDLRRISYTITICGSKAIITDSIFSIKTETRAYDADTREHREALDFYIMSLQTDPSKRKEWLDLSWKQGWNLPPRLDKRAKMVYDDSIDYERLNLDLFRFVDQVVKRKKDFELFKSSYIVNEKTLEEDSRRLFRLEGPHYRGYSDDSYSSWTERIDWEDLYEDQREAYRERALVLREQDTFISTIYTEDYGPIEKLVVPWMILYPDEFDALHEFFIEIDL